MLRLLLLPTLLRETAGARSLPREPEPDLIMEGADQVAAYTLAGRINGIMAAAYLFHSAQASKVLGECRTAVDLGCGPATQLAQIAALNPNTHFTGIDLSEAMLDNARHHIAELDLQNVNLLRDDITRLDSIADSSAEAVISTMALHHLPSNTIFVPVFNRLNEY